MKRVLGLKARSVESGTEGAFMCSATVLLAPCATAGVLAEAIMKRARALEHHLPQVGVKTSSSFRSQTDDFLSRGGRLDG